MAAPKVGDKRSAGKCWECGLPVQEEYQSVMSYHDNTYDQWRSTHDCLKDIGKAIQDLKYRVAQLEGGVGSAIKPQHRTNR